MKRVLLLSSDTTHHRAFMHILRRAGLEPAQTIFETSSITAQFPTGPLFENEQDEFEREKWHGMLSLDGFPTSSLENINSDAALREMGSCRPDLGVVFGTRRLTPDVVGQFPDGLINVHRGIAQAFRGLDSELWAIYHHEWDNIGVTLHRVDNELDTGSIIESHPLPLAPNMKCHQLRYHTTNLAAEMVIRALSAYRSGVLPGGTQQTERARYYSFMPLELKKVVRRRFDRYCEALEAHV